MELEFSRRIFEKSSNTKFHENPSSGSRVVPLGRTDMTKTKQIVAFCDFTNAPQNHSGGGGDLVVRYLPYCDSHVPEAQCPIQTILVTSGEVTSLELYT
jgi:hypothetical protein